MGYWSDWSHRRQEEAKAVGGQVVTTLRGGAEAFSDRAPTPKQIGGPIADLGLGVVSSGLGLGQKIIDTSFLQLQEPIARTIVGGLDPVFGEGAPLDISAPARAGDYGGALRQLPVSAATTIAAPLTAAGQALTLPLLVVAGILLLK